MIFRFQSTYLCVCPAPNLKISENEYLPETAGGANRAVRLEIVKLTIGRFVVTPERIAQKISLRYAVNVMR